MEKQLKIRFEGLDKLIPFHSFAGGPKLKMFTHVCVLSSRDFNSNVSDSESSEDEQDLCRGTDHSSELGEKRDELKALFKTKRQRKERRRKRRDQELRSRDSEQARDGLYSKFIFHVAGRKNKVHLLYRMAKKRGIGIPNDVCAQDLLQFNARPMIDSKRTEA